MSNRSRVGWILVAGELIGGLMLPGAVAAQPDERPTPATTPAHAFVDLRGASF